MPWELPPIDKCCGCVTDLKTAAAIIAVLGIVTSPAVSWAVVRHSYVIRVSCFMTTNAIRPDVIDINLSNVLSFGFGANAGLPPSCLGPPKVNKTSEADKSTNKTSQNSGRRTSNESPEGLLEHLRTDSSEQLRDAAQEKYQSYVNAVRYVGWIVLVADLVFVFCSIFFLFKIFYGPDRFASSCFIYAACVSIACSFVYGLMYIGACIAVGGAIPVFEMAFCLFDALVWIYFLIVVMSYRGQDGDRRTI